MSSFLNRLKNLKPGSINLNSNEGDSGSICSFDEEGFLCPICHQKFIDTKRLEHHYLQAHSAGEATANHPKTNGTKHEETDDTLQETSIWKQQFIVSEESRMQLSSELMQQRQRVGDLEEELELLRKQLDSAQAKVIEQSQTIGNLKASTDVYDAQITMFTDELLSTQSELKEKQNQMDTLCNDLIPRPTNDDVDVLKRELISVQQRMNEMALENEQQIEPLRQVLSELYKYSQRFDQFESIFDQTISVYDQILTQQTSEIENDLQQIKQLTRDGKEKFLHALKHSRVCLNEKQTEIERLKQTNVQLEADLEHRNRLNEQLTNDLQMEKKQSSSYRNEIETLTNDIREWERSFEELKQEKNQLLLNKMDGDEDDERQNLVRRLTQDKDQHEQQIKDLRKQIKQFNEERDRLQQEIETISKQFTEITYEKNQLHNEINSLKQQLEDSNNEKERQINESIAIRDEQISVHQQLQENLRELNENHKNVIERLETESEEMKFELTDKINQLEKETNEHKQSIDQQVEILNQTKCQLESIENEKIDREKQIETITAQFQSELNEKNQSIARLSLAIRRSIDLAHHTQKYIQEKIHTSQANLLAMIEQSEQEFRYTRTQTFEAIRNEFTDYLTVVHRVIVDHQNKFQKQIEEDQSQLLAQQLNGEEQFNQMTNERDQLTKEYEEQKQQLAQVNQNLLQVSESLAKSTQTANTDREKFENQIAVLKEELSHTRTDLESRSKKYEMQATALSENLSTVRGDLKVAHEKLIDYQLIKTEKADLEAQLVANQDERESLLERSVTSENRNEKLLLENGQLAKKNGDLEFALQEIAREYQGLQIQNNKVSERRWLNDSNVHECMKCNQTFSLTQRKHHCRSCGNVFCDNCSSKTAIVAAASKKPQRVCDQCFKDLTS